VIPDAAPFGARGESCGDVGGAEDGVDAGVVWVFWLRLFLAGVFFAHFGVCVGVLSGCWCWIMRGTESIETAYVGASELVLGIYRMLFPVPRLTVFCGIVSFSVCLVLLDVFSGFLRKQR